MCCANLSHFLQHQDQSAVASSVETDLMVLGKGHICVGDKLEKRGNSFGDTHVIEASR